MRAGLRFGFTAWSLVIGHWALSACALTNDIRALKGPVEVPSGLSGYLWLGGLLLAAVAAFLCRRFLRKFFARPATVAPPVPPHVRARQKLAAALAYLSDPKRFCSDVSNTLRVYLEERFKFHAPERTTEEFLVELQGSRLLDDQQKQSLAEFLQSCDLVKFARLEPTELALRDLHAAALRLVEETQFDSMAQPGNAAVTRAA